MTRRRLLLGPPPWQSALTLAVGAAVGVPLLLVVLDDGAAVLGPVAGLAVLLLFLVRQGRSAVLLEGDLLVVRNLLRTWRLRREDVVDVAVGAPPGSGLGGWQGGRAWGEALVVRLVDGRLVVADASRDELGLAQAREAAAAAERAVREWLLGLDGDVVG